MSIHPLQTLAWANFRKEWGNDVFYNKKLLITFSKIPFTKYTIGTSLKTNSIQNEILNIAKKIGFLKKAIFIKFEPNVLFDQQIRNRYIKFGLIEGKNLFTPSSFWIDLTKSENELLKSFSSKTRYNIRLAQRHGVIIKEDNSDKAFEKYIKLTFETAKRQGFYAHTEKYHRLMWKHLHKSLVNKNITPIAHLFTANYKGQVVSAWILFTYDKFLYYPYGASTDIHKEIMANNLMMWKAIQFGKKMGLEKFDLWGREEGKGFTKFKEGYNPRVVKFIGSWDLVINKPLYIIYNIVDKIRWFLLRLKTKI